MITAVKKVDYQTENHPSERCQLREMVESCNHSAANDHTQNRHQRSAERTPGCDQRMTMIPIGMSRLGFFVSCAAVETASKPMNAKNTTKLV